MDHSVTRDPEQTGHHRTLVVVIALMGVALLALFWLLAAPAAGIG